MKEIVYLNTFKKCFKKLPKDIQETFFDKLELYLKNSRHPSLRVKRIRGIKGDDEIWEMSLNKSYRVTFEETEEDISLRRIGTHAMLSKP